MEDNKYISHWEYTKDALTAERRFKRVETAERVGVIEVGFSRRYSDIQKHSAIQISKKRFKRVETAE